MIYFPKLLVRLKTKFIQSPWITKKIAKSSKRKKKLYEKFLKHRTRETDLAKSLKKTLRKNITQKKYLTTNMMPKEYGVL